MTRYNEAMMRADVAGLVDRDWDLVAESKIAAWRDKSMTLQQAFQLWDGMWRYTRRLRPDWPSEESRAEDLAAHVRLAELFHRASGSPSR